MKPFILQFAERPDIESYDHSTLYYDQDQNLNIDRNTGKPAIAALNLGTETLTKVHGEQSSDAERNDLSFSMGTETITLVNSESSDSDYGRSALMMALGTSTETRQYLEQSDSDYRSS